MSQTSSAGNDTQHLSTVLYSVHVRLGFILAQGKLTGEMLSHTASPRAQHPLALA
ncbi:hypothetical protein [Plesiomonas shigelloides]|uniref:hypothetical protein n=1 Tax=Plesiomonas shigelloides TaxID=703 RepID=UPI0014834178|nr:hypothetical protein [Plesiomonas shigelloides]